MQKWILYNGSSLKFNNFNTRPLTLTNLIFQLIRWISFITVCLFNSRYLSVRLASFQAWFYATIWVSVYHSHFLCSCCCRLSSPGSVADCYSQLHRGVALQAIKQWVNWVYFFIVMRRPRNWSHWTKIQMLSLSEQGWSKQEVSVKAWSIQYNNPKPSTSYGKIV